ncbi:MAG: DegT/DnrJ/EryC1/StrS family aminotransferase [Lachnospiraceae bacterium]|nr:DegT/DnrJ/EryC1/StrS family aminotransferase [Lachnospiraceae bacterium]
MKTIPFSPPDMSAAEIEEVVKTLESGWITTGPRTKEFEKRIAEYVHTDKAVCLNSCTAAEELNLRVLGVGPGDEVIVPAYTYTATASAAIHVGAEVKMIDSGKDTAELDYDRLADMITERTKAVIPVDLGGVVCDYGKIYEAVESGRSCFRPNSRIQEALGRVAVVADAAHSFGAQREGKMAGEFADFTSFSFHAVKNLTTAEGGAAVWKTIPGIDNEELYHQYQLLSLHGQSKDALAKTKLGAWEYDIVGPWYKCNMTDIMAAIGLRQLDRYESLLERRRAIIARYNEALDALGVWHLSHWGENFTASGHLYITRIPGADLSVRNRFITRMAEEGVSANVHYKPLPMMTAYKNLGFDIREYPNAYRFFENEITLPLHTRLSDEDVEKVIEVFTKVYRELLG